MVLTAALVAAGAATSMAQVYSLNIVGYINVPIQSGFQMISCPLVTSPDNTLATLFGAPTPNLPNGTTFYFFNGAGYNLAIVNRSAWSNGGTNVLSPGTGCFVSYPAGQPATNFTFVGQVLSATSTGGPLTNNVVSGFQIISPQIPVSGTIDTNLQYTPHNGDTVYTFTPPNGPYFIDAYNRNAWGEGAPTNSPGQSFWLNASAASAGPWVETNNFTGQ
jgi:hypothetical protein